MIVSLVVVYDATCGSCSAIAGRLSRVLAPPVIVRSCRDPHLGREFPALAGLPRCAAPLLIVRGPGGAVEVLKGPRMMWRGATLVAPGRWPAALKLAAWIGWQRALHLPRRRETGRTATY
ncbi:hypothetical protein [Streptosporangium sp. NPDC000396]|uniref:hypothetical protein n=1 Tax=Streptosporangium sp. NPDC000396 TaxID=3366185 RepID=UPI0036CD338E